MITKKTSLVLAAVIAAVGGVAVGSQVPASSPQALKAMLTPAPAQTSIISDTTAPLPVPAAQAKPSAAQAVKPEARMEPSSGEAPTGLRLETKTTKIVFDPLRGRASLDVTPKFNITLDAQKREAGLTAGSVYLGTAR